MGIPCPQKPTERCTNVAQRAIGPEYLHKNPADKRKNPEAAGPRGAQDSDYFRAAIGK